MSGTRRTRAPRLRGPTHDTRGLPLSSTSPASFRRIVVLRRWSNLRWTKNQLQVVQKLVVSRVAVVQLELDHQQALRLVR